MNTPIRLGDASFNLLPKQWEFVFCRERMVNYTGGFGSGKTRAGIYRGSFCSMQPNNIGLVGRAAATDLILTTQREMLDFFKEANLLKSEPGKKHGAIVYCVDPETNRSLGETSEIHFQHMEDPDHLHGYQLGWVWPDERSEIPYASWLKLIGRLRLKNVPFRTAFSTGNPNGRDWGFDYWFNPEKLLKLPIASRLERRGIHATSYENHFLPEQYLADMAASYPEEWLKRYLLGDMDVFEGQAFKEFSHSIHCVDTRECRGFVNGQPPESWERALGIDVGGIDPWAFEFGAIDRLGNIIMYDEIYRPGVVASEFAEEALKKMGTLHFQSKVIDWENKVAAGELHRSGLVVTNAHKRGKMDSITQFGGYLHPNPRRPYPEWHPRAGEPGSPSIFFTEGVPNLVRETGQQRWKKMVGSEHTLNQLDDRISEHAFMGCLYLCKERPRPEHLPKASGALQLAADIDLRSSYFYQLRAEQEKFKSNQRQYHAEFPPFRQKVENALWS